MMRTEAKAIFSRNLNARLEDKKMGHLTPTQLAYRLNQFLGERGQVANRTMIKWLDAERLPTQQQFEWLMAWLHCTADDLLDEEHRLFLTKQ